MIGDFLYGLTPRDQQGVGIEIVHRFVRNVGVGVSQQAPFTVPAGRVLRLTRVWCEFAPSATDYITNAEIYLNTPDNAEFYPIKLNSIATNVAGVPKGETGIFDFSGQLITLTGLTVNMEWDGEIWLEPGATIAARAFFSNAALSHTVLAVFIGLLLPRGNLVV